jgi:hypothetical protein
MRPSFYNLYIQYIQIDCIVKCNQRWTAWQQGRWAGKKLRAKKPKIGRAEERKSRNKDSTEIAFFVALCWKMLVAVSGLRSLSIFFALPLFGSS